MLVWQTVWGGGDEVLAEDNLFLECAFRRLVAAFVEVYGVRDYAVARREALDF